MASPLVLIVDELGDAREEHAELLAAAGYRVAFASDGDGAIAKARELIPDVILMHLSLDEGDDGFEATRKLKKDERTKRIPVLAMTGLTRTHASRARRAGCVGYITRPCPPAVLVDEVKRVIQVHGRRAS